jgi:hypothetical protein
VKRLGTETPDARILSDTEEQLFAYLENERQAVEMAKHITLPKNASYELIENSVALLLVCAKESADGYTVQVEYLGGVRRDTLRLQ